MKNLTVAIASSLMIAGCMCTDAAMIGGSSVHGDGGVLSPGDAGGSPVHRADGGVEVCGNGFDDNNNGLIDEGCTCTKDQIQSCWTGLAAQRHVGACKDGTQTCTGGGELADWSACGNVKLPSVEVPGNCVDEDCDGQAPGCPVGCGGELSEVCNNGVDDNCDGKVDCADPTCLSDAACTPCPNSQPEINELCHDGIDNDCNGKADCAEPACAGMCTTCVPTSPSEFNCNDHVDDDCDGKIDCADPDCRFPGQCGCALHETACHDGKDDNCNGAVDCADVDCEICTPGANRYCDEPNFCHFGQQTCNGDGTWGKCHEVSPPSQCKAGGIGGIFGTDYDQACCVAAGLCCQNYQSGGGSIGMCGNSVSCRP